MARPAIAARLTRLETLNRPTRIRHTVLTFNALTGEAIGRKPKGPCMVVPHFGTDEEWSEHLQAQQARLIESAQIEGQGT